MIRATATFPHYRHHLDPIVAHLPSSRFDSAPFIAPDDVVLVASYRDVLRFPDNPKIYVEHGAGQTYNGAPVATPQPGYSDAASVERHQNVIGYLCPSVTVAERWIAAGVDPEIVRVVGCPAISRFVGSPRQRMAAITFHFPAQIGVPECGTAWYEWQDHLPALVHTLRSEGWTVVGHEHPRWNGELAPWWTRLGVMEVSRDVILSHAGLLVADNTSLMYEAAACGASVIAMNSARWRKDVEHGLRFWSHVPGNEMDDLSDLDWCLDELELTGEEQRIEAVRHAYGPGNRAYDDRHAADVVLELVDRHEGRA